MNNLRKITINALIIMFLLVSLSGCIESKDKPVIPNHGFFMGILPTIAEDQEFDDAYIQAAQYCEFVPVWSSGTGADGFWDYNEKLEGNWGKQFIKGLIRGNNMFPLIHFSFIDKNNDGDLILKTHSDIPDATLSDPEWRSLYRNSILDVVKTGFM